jgi:hypothetical protein
MLYLELEIRNVVTRACVCLVKETDFIRNAVVINPGDWLLMKDYHEVVDFVKHAIEDDGAGNVVVCKPRWIEPADFEHTIREYLIKGWKRREKRDTSTTTASV